MRLERLNQIRKYLETNALQSAGCERFTILL
jgi:hypothetical protein